MGYLIYKIQNIYKESMEIQEDYKYVDVKIILMILKIQVIDFLQIHVLL